MKIFFLFWSLLFVNEGFSQSKFDNLFFLQSQSSVHFDPSVTEKQIIPLDFEQIVLNDICDVDENTLIIRESGIYSLTSYVCFNPGMNPKSIEDFITINVSLIAFEDTFSKKQTLSAQTQSYMYGNLSVAEQIQLPERITFLKKGTRLRLYVRRMPYSTLELNKNPHYYHMDPPTGMRYSMALRIEKK